MKAKRLKIGLLTIALTAVPFYSCLIFNSTRASAGDVQENAPQTVDKTFIKDGDEILSPSQWIDKSLREISEIKPSMRRVDLKESFSQDGGLSHPERSRYVYRRCAIKIEVEFKRAAGKEVRDKDGRLLGGEYDDDVITKVSKPYLELPFND